MLSRLKTLAMVVLVVAGCVAAAPAKADPVETVNMTFLSGATFSGTVTFAPGYSEPEAVTGILTGYQYGTIGYAGSGSDVIDWVWEEGFNYSTTPDVFSTWLMDGPVDDYSAFTNYIGFTYNYSGAPSLTFDSNPADGYPGYVNNAINGNGDFDPLVSGSIGSSVTPEPGTFLLLGSGLLGFAGMVRRRIGSRV